MKTEQKIKQYLNEELSVDEDELLEVGIDATEIIDVLKQCEVLKKNVKDMVKIFSITGKNVAMKLKKIIKNKKYTDDQKAIINDFLIEYFDGYFGMYDPTTDLNFIDYIDIY